MLIRSENNIHQMKISEKQDDKNINRLLVNTNRHEMQQDLGGEPRRFNSLFREP